MKELLNHTGYYTDGLFSERFYPLQPDEWPVGGHRIFQGTPSDLEYFGDGTIRIETGHELIPTLAIKVYITGTSPRYISGNPRHARIRCQVEFLKDGEPSDFTGGWLYLTHAAYEYND